MRQLGYDQSTIHVTGKMGYSSLLTAEAQFIGEGKEHIEVWVHIFSCKERIGMRSLGGLIYWKKNLSKIYEFVLIQDEKTLEITEAVPYRVIFCIARRRGAACCLAYVGCRRR